MVDTQSPVVLLVDDDLDVLGANARYLRTNHIDVIVAESAHSALNRLATDDINLILTDLRMPNCSGLEFAAKARESRPLIPIIFFSGYAEVSDVVAAMKLGAVEFLEKPIDPDQLLSVVRKASSPVYSPSAAQRHAFELLDQQFPLKMRVLAYEKFLIESCLLQHDGDVTRVLEALQINRRTLNDKMARLGIKRESLFDDSQKGPENRKDEN